MSRLPIQASELFAEFREGGLLAEFIGADLALNGIAPREQCGPGDLVFVANVEDLSGVLERKPAAVVVPEDARETEAGGVVLMTSTNVAVAHACIRQKYHAPDPRESEWGAVHPSAVIHESAKLAAGVVVGPQAVIGADVQLGANTVIQAAVVVERGAVLGADCVIHPRVVIGYDCQLGDRVIVKSGSVIGSEGFGFAQDAKRASYRIPQTGRVVIEDDVEVGALCAIDRATYAETRIGRGTKFDNVCHVAHNVQIGEDCLLTAGLVVAGSTKIGDRVIASGMTGILDHLEVANDVILVHRAAVIESIEEPGIYAGNPAQPLKPYLRNSAISRNLTDLRKRISNLEKKSEP